MAKLFIPGPTNVDPLVAHAQTHEMIGHRSQACADLMMRIQPRIREVFLTENPVYIFPSSGTGLQEASFRNCVLERVLVCVNGAFSERWLEVALQNGIPAEQLAFEWGRAVQPDDVLRRLQGGRFDALAIVHNETSTGVENPVEEIAKTARMVNPEITILVDAVSSAGGVEIPTDRWGLDVVFTSSQKCFALPPGLAFAAVSAPALEKAERVQHRGWYFDFLVYHRYHLKYMTPTTPAVSLLYALDAQLDRMLAEGISTRFARHLQLATRAQSWGADRFALFAEDGHRSKTLTTIRNTHGIEFGSLAEHLAAQNMVISNGYGRLKGDTFRIGHMGECSMDDLEKLLAAIDDFLNL